MPTTTTPPDSAALPPAAGASAATSWDRLEADIRALKQQAQATQKSIQQLQAHEAPDPLQTVQSALPDLPGDWDGMAVGAAAGLAVALALVWWALWVRPQWRLRRAESASAGSALPPGADLPSGSNLARLRRLAQDGLPTQHDPNMGFNSEAAASEVTRVRKSLAEKREARALHQEFEEATQTLSPQARAWLDPDRPDPLDGVVVNSGPVPIVAAVPNPVPPPATLRPVIDISALEPMLDIDLDLEPEVAPPPEPERQAQPEPLPELPPEPSLSLEPLPESEPRPEPAPQPDASAWPDTDFGITLALAQESETLNLWTEARELATEVLESPALDLRNQALALLARLDAREEALAREAQQAALGAQDEAGS